MATYSGTEGTCQWTINDQGHLYIGSGVISHNTTSYTDWSWHPYRNEIISVSSGQVTWAVGANACRMFYGCNHLNLLDISNFDTSNVTNMEHMFNHCEALTSLNLSNFDTSNITSMAYMFSFCTNLTSLDLSSFNTSNVTTMNGMFSGCNSLISLDLSNFNTSNVTNMSYMFSSCTTLQCIIVSNLWNINAVATSTNMFSGCTLLHGGAGTIYNSSATDVSMAHIDEGVSNPGYLVHINNTEMYASFDSDNGQLTIFRDVEDEYDSSGTGEVRGTVTYWSGVEDITGQTNPKWYNKRSSIQSVQILNKFSPKTAYKMFNGCNNNNLTSLNLLILDTSNVTNMNQMFNGCKFLTSLDLSSFNTTNVIDMGYMFYNCDSLTSLNLSNFDTSSVTNMQCMFYNCESLTSLEISNFDTSEVTNMADMFVDCQLLTSLDLSNFNTSKVTDMRYMFCGCYNLTSLNLYSFDTSNVTNMSSMFYNIGVQIIIVSSLWTTNALLKSQDMFWACLNLVGEKETAYNSSHVDGTYAHIDGGTSNPGYLTNINSVPCYASFNSDTGELRIFRDVAGKYDSSGTGEVIGNITYWSGIENITGTTLPKWYNKGTNIRSVKILNKFSPKTAFFMFMDCSLLTSLDLSNLDTSNVTNMANMFFNCNSLTSLDLSNFNTSNVTHMGGMFNHCSSLTSLNLLNFNTVNVTSMSVMFNSCRSLTYLELKVSNIPQYYSSIFDGTNCPVYIINALDSSTTNPTKAQVATAWREIVASYSNAHYEADDLIVTFNAPPVVSRGIFADFDNLVSSTLTTSFTYQSNNLLPHGWKFDINKVTGCLENYTTNYLTDTNPSFSTNTYQKRIDNYYFNDKTNAIVSLYITIYDANNNIKENNRENSATVEIFGANKPILDDNFIIDSTNKFLYQFIGSTQQVGIYAYDESYNYGNVDNIPFQKAIDGNNYTVTKLNIDIYDIHGNPTVYGCFENNLTVTGISFIPSGITNMNRCCYGCTELEGNIIFLPFSSSTPTISYTNAFTNTDANKIIFLLDGNNVGEAIASDGIRNNKNAAAVASAFTNVSYEAEDNDSPTLSITMQTQRYIYDATDEKWKIDDDDGTWVSAEVSITLKNNRLPVEWVNALKTFTCLLNSQSITVKDSDYGNVSINTFNFTGNPLKATVTIYIEVGTQPVILDFNITDKFDKSASDTQKVNPIFAMLDFVPGGQGMAIGKIANRNGLEIAIPTAIGEGLKVPTVTVNGRETVDLTKYQLVIGQYNNKKEEAFLVIGSGTSTTHRQNALEIGYQETQEQGNTLLIPYYTLGLRAENNAIGYYSMAEGYYTQASGLYSHAQNNSTIANKHAQTAIGKYNIADTAVNEADQKALIIGNGTADNARSNALTIDWNGNVTRGDGASYTAVQITRWS